MSSILNLEEARERAVRWSVEDYEQYGEMLADHGVLPKRAELIRGIIIEKMPKSSLQVKLTEWLRNHFLGRLTDGYRIMQEGPLRLSDSEPEPDIAVVRGDLDEAEGHPKTALLVVEIAVTSVALDREYTRMYAEAGIPEYWIVVAAQRAVEVYRDPVRGVYQTFRAFNLGEELQAGPALGVAVSLDELFGGTRSHADRDFE